MKDYMFNGFNINEPKNKKKKHNTKLNWSKIIKTIILTFIIVFIILFSILYTKNDTVRHFFDVYIFKKYALENDLPFIELNTTENYFFHSFNGKIIVLNKNTLTFYDKHGNIDNSLNIEVTNPLFMSNGKYLCVAENAGQKAYLIYDKNIVWQNDFEGNISNISINKNGYLAISLSGTTYKSIVELIDPQGNEMFKSFINSSYVIDTAISEDNKYLSIAEANLSGALIQSNIEVISIDAATKNNENSTLYNYVAPSDSLVINIKYINKNILACKFNDAISFLNTNNEISEVSNFNTQRTIFANINQDVIQLVATSSSKFELQIISSSNNVKTYELDNEPNSIKVSENVTAVNLGSKILFINNNGWLIKQYEASQEIKSVVLCDDIAGIIYNNKIEILSI